MPARTKRAFTLVELLISMTITLIMVYALVEFMKYVGDTVTEGRGQIEMAGSVRGVRRQLYRDLQLITVFQKPSPDQASGNGYLEIIEGFRSDSNPNATSYSAAFVVEANQALDRDLNGTNDNLESKGPALGDTDDYLGFTARNPGDPFVGKYSGTSVTSELAEIIWFTSHFQFDSSGTGVNIFSDPTRIAESTLYRRVLLIRPDLNTNYDNADDIYYVGKYANQTATNVYTQLRTFWQSNDVSARIVQKGNNFYIVANSLGDLSRRENRFAHVPLQFPSQLDMSSDSDSLLTDTNQKCPFILKGSRLGEDIMLSHVTGFDLRVYDPTARVRTDPNKNITVLLPGDPGYTTSGVADIGLGAYVDLGWQRFVDLTAAPSSVTMGSEAQREAFPFYWPARLIANKYNQPRGYITSNYNASTMLFCTYDTWSFSYEHDGINQSDGCVDFTTMMPVTKADEGTDGLDNDNRNGVDDPGERETMPPCPAQLQGLQARIRVYDQSLRIGRQATVIAEFTK